jgi:hypothetical protein
MIHVQLKQQHQVRCDRCGQPASTEWWDTVETAKHAAFSEGFREYYWREGGCARETIRCSKCELESKGRDPVP